MLDRGTRPVAASWNPDRMSFFFPRSSVMSPTANTPGRLVWNFAVSTSRTSPRPAIVEPGCRPNQLLSCIGLHRAATDAVGWVGKSAVDTEKSRPACRSIRVGDITLTRERRSSSCPGSRGGTGAFAIQHHLYPQKKQFLQYTTTSPVMHRRLGVPTDLALEGDAMT